MTGVQVTRFSWEGSQPAVVTRKRIPGLKHADQKLAYSV
jgi:hypothetical protein